MKGVVRPCTSHSCSVHKFVTWSQKWPSCWHDVSRAAFRSLLSRSRSHHNLAAKSCPANNFVISLADFENILHKWSPSLDDVSLTTFGSLPWRSKSQHDLAASSCPTHNFVIWSQISKQLHRNDHHIETTCRVHKLGPYQGHSTSFQQNCVRPITMLFKVRF